MVDAGQSSNVGGIAGTNSGTLDQVFNSVVTVTKTETGATDANGRKLYNYTYTDGGAISGASNVGGIVGSNTAEGQLSNAYSTTAVAGNSNVANIVGSNAGQVSNIYGYAANRNTNVTNVNGGTVRNSYIINADGKLQNGKDAKKLDSYDFDNNKDTTWKLYDKRTNPLLKVFLTKVTVAPDLQHGWVYDATNHLDIHGWINSGKLKTNDAANDAFKAYKNNNSLLQGEALKNVGKYSSWLWSGQIASGGEVGPNNLGYDFTVGDITVTKKVLDVTGNTVNRTYGSLLKKDDYGLSIDYELSINGFGGFNDAMKAELNGKVTITDSQETIQNSKDKGIITVGNEKRTDNKGTYNWQAGVKLDDSLKGNYEFKNDGVSSATTTVQGVSKVLARKVYLNDINASTKYGSKEGLKADGNVSLKENSIVYGDQVSLKDGASVSYKADGEYAANKGGRDTADADTYADSLKIDNAALTGDANKLGNYELVNNATGSITVKQAEMHVKLNGVERTYGNTALINGTSYGVNGLTGNVNGDNYGVGDVNMGAVTGDGALTGASTGKVTNDAGDTYKWNANVAAANDKLQQNYKLVVDGGASVVKPATLKVSLNDVVRTYGNATITSGGYSASGIEGLVNGDSYNAGDIKVTVTGDGAIAGVSGNRVTNDVDNNYTWRGNLTTDNARLDKNYKLELKGDGVSKVGKAKLNVGLSDVYRTYGNAKITSGSYSAGNITGLVNGDNYDASDFKVTVNSDGAIAGVTGDRVTNDYGEYTWNGTIEAANAGLNKNYDLVVNANGKSYVDKATLNVSLNDVVRTYGNTSFTDGTSYGIKNHDALVNGDEGTLSIKEGAITDGGLVDNNSKTNNKDDYKWTVGENGIVAENVANFAKNYDIKVTAGNSKVNPKKIYLNNINASTTYGSKEGLKADGNVSLQDNSIVYGDQVSLKDGASVSYKADGEYAANKGGRDTADADTYADSLKIDNAALTGDANKLGNYELVNNATGSITVKQAEMHVKLNGVERTYGNTALINGTVYGVNGLTGNVNGDNYAAGDVNIGTVTGDGALTGEITGKVTNDADTYKWNADVAAANDKLKLKQNYKLVVDGGASVVKQATLQVSLNDVVRTYGNAAITSGGYSASNITGLVNGDSYNAGDVKVTVTGDGAIAGVSSNRVTNDADDYTWSGTLTTENAALKNNYKLELKGDGKSVVGKATLNVGLSDVYRTYGNAKITNGSYSAGNITGLVNGDSYDASAITVNKTSDGAIDGVSGSKVTNDAGNYEWTGSASTTNAGLNKNYNLVVKGNGKSYVGKAQLSVSLNDVVRTYGNATITSGGYSASNITGLVNGDSYDASAITVNKTSDGAIDGVSGNRVTNDADDYTWSGDLTTENAALKNNYKLELKGDGKSVVGKATLNVGLNDVVRTYGNATITSGGYSASSITGLVNGDSYNASDVKVTVNSDGALTGNTEGKATNDHGNYEWSGDLTTDNVALKNNYKLELKGNGVSKVEKAKLTFVVDDKTITQGVPAEYTGKANGLTNGDTLAGIGVGGYELDSSVNPLIVGVYEDKIGVLINGSLHLTGGDGLLKNYKVEIDPGTLTVLASFNPADDYWFGTAPWDKERNLRERKAEFHYVAGGMSL